MLHFLSLSVFVLHFSTCCLRVTYLTGFCIQNLIKTSLGNLQEIVRNHLQLQFIVKSSQEIVKIYSKFSRLLLTFKVKVISVLLLLTSRKVYKTVSCLLASRNFPVQCQFHNIRKTVFRMFFYVVVVPLSG